MSIYIAFSLLITIAIGFAYINFRFIKMQTTSAIMVGSISLSFLLLLLDKFGLSHFDVRIEHLVARLHFHDLLINGMLSFLLFAGALTINWRDFKNQRWEIFVLAIFSTLASTFLVAGLSYLILNWVGITIPFKYCFLFGALISPTDPIAVLAMLTDMKAPKKLAVIIAGESLFNDGVGIVIFITAYQIVFSTTPPTIHSTLILFSQQALGGIGFGLILGFSCNYLMRGISDNKLQILLTIAVATGGYALAGYLNVSGPLAMVVAGIMVGNACRENQNQSEVSYQILEGFWEIIDELLNAVLFLLIGFEILLMSHHTHQIFACLIAIPLVLLVRAITVSVPMRYFKAKRKYPADTVNILIWGGLRGGLAVALALSIPNNSYRDLILSMTYSIVLFAILIQGTSVKLLVNRSIRKSVKKHKN